MTGSSIAPLVPGQGPARRHDGGTTGLANDSSSQYFTLKPVTTNGAADTDYIRITFANLMNSIYDLARRATKTANTPETPH